VCFWWLKGYQIGEIRTGILGNVRCAEDTTLQAVTIALLARVVVALRGPAMDEQDILYDYTVLYSVDDRHKCPYCQKGTGRVRRGEVRLTPAGWLVLSFRLVCYRCSKDFEVSYGMDELQVKDTTVRQQQLL
jgi:hypothetical protein